MKAKPDKVIALLVKWGNSEECASKMVDTHWERMTSCFPDSSNSKVANILRVCYSLSTDS